MKQKTEQPKTTELTHGEALSLFNDLESSSLKSTDKKILRSAVNFHLYLEEQLKKPGLRLKDIRALFGIKFDAPNSNDSSEDSDASDDQSNKGGVSNVLLGLKLYKFIDVQLEIFFGSLQESLLLTVPTCKC